MTNEKIKSANEVVTEFLGMQAQDEDLDPGTLEAIGKLRDEGKLTKTNLLRQLEALRKVVVIAAPAQGLADD